jgi:predicted transcriptional regulator
MVTVMRKEGFMASERSTWTFLTNHSHVLFCLAVNPSLTMKDIAKKVGITERAVQKIVADLRDENYIILNREGRCNRYHIQWEQHLKHPIESHRTVRDLILLIENVQESNTEKGS